MRPLVVIALKPLIQVCLQFFYRNVEFFPESLPEEFIKNSSVEPLNKTVGSGTGVDLSDSLEVKDYPIFCLDFGEGYIPLDLSHYRFRALLGFRSHRFSPFQRIPYNLKPSLVLSLYLSTFL
jgi:hypothetical protein